jgi:hypothetical protein
MSRRRKAWLGAIGLVAFIGAFGACSSATSAVLPPDGLVPLGNWGGDSSAMIVSDTATHLHIACTYGDVSGRIAFDATGAFDVSGSYMLRAYPITVGPTVPARFVGRLNGSTLTVTAIVNDTTQHKTVTRGPVIVTLNGDPKLGPCPICRRPIVTKLPIAH